MPTLSQEAARAALLNEAIAALGGAALPAGQGIDLGPYRALLPRGQARGSLTAILSTLGPPDQPAPKGAALAAGALALQREAIMPGGAGLPGPGFPAEWAQLRDPAGADFEAACGLVEKYGWAIQGACGVRGLSRWQEFKLLGALIHASGFEAAPAGAFTLVAGDFPGIQNALYTITSKGAARGLRGRSLFLQLLADAVARRLLADFELPDLNLVYAAGGNFVLLAPAGAEAQVEARITEITRRLVSYYHGDISLVAACEALPASDLAGPGFAARYRALKAALGRAKLRPFAAALQAGEDLFSPQGGASADHCAVCYHDPGPRENLDPYQDSGDLWCAECLGFDALARALSDRQAYLSVDTQYGEGQGWQDYLYAISGFWYELHAAPPRGGRFYVLNSTDFVQSGAAGFRFLAARTPHDADGSIREFESLAKAAQGIRRIGVLRMDVDNLGRIFGEYLQAPGLASISAASEAMSLFFNGWINVICDEVEQDTEKPNTLYLIYAGGDDLFVVGPWSLLPLLAQRVHDDLAAYTGGNPHITISAGISIGQEGFPLYREAERARQALDDEAKAREGKNAISFLGEVVGWEPSEWGFLLAEVKRLQRMRKGDMPRALIQTIRRLHAQSEAQRQQARRAGVPAGREVFGRWMWMQAYSLTRLARQHPGHDQDMRALQQNLLTPEHIHLAGLAARWVDYLERSRNDDGRN